jgi:hypothetical protein
MGKGRNSGTIRGKNYLLELGLVTYIRPWLSKERCRTRLFGGQAQKGGPKKPSDFPQMEIGEEIDITAV